MSVILVVGSPGSGKKTLVQGLVRLLNAGQGSAARDGVEGHEAEALVPAAIVVPDRQELIEPADATFDVFPASIATKYYNAQVSFWQQTQATVPVLALRSADKLEGLEGIIVVFDLRQESSFDEAAQWAAFVDDREQCSFRVCVGSKLDLLPENGEEPASASGYAEKFSPPLEAMAPAHQNGGGEEGGAAATTVAEGLQDRRARCQEWCLDHGFEYVEADCRDLERGGGPREKEGVPRIVEALQSNMWTGMEFCTDSRPSLMSSVVAAGGSRGGGGEGDGGGTGPASGSSERGDGAAALAASMAGGEQEVSEYLSGFVDGDDGFGEYAGYGALDSGGEDDEDGEAGDGCCGDSRTGGDPGKVGHSIGATATAAILAGGGGSRGRGRGSIEGDDGGGVVDLSHIELQTRWEQRDPGCPAARVGAPRGDEAATTQIESGQAPPESVRESAPVHHGDNRDKIEVAVKPGDMGATSACMPSESSTGADGGDGGEGECGESAAVGGDAGAGEVGASATKSEEYLLEAAGSMVDGVGGDLEGDEMEQLMSEVRKARELGSSVPDAERRARAADVAMRLAALLGELGDDSGDDDDDDDR